MCSTAVLQRSLKVISGKAVGYSGGAGQLHGGQVVPAIDK